MYRVTQGGQSEGKKRSTKVEDLFSTTPLDSRTHQSTPPFHLCYQAPHPPLHMKPPPPLCYESHQHSIRIEVGSSRCSSSRTDRSLPSGGPVPITANVAHTTTVERRSNSRTTLWCLYLSAITPLKFLKKNGVWGVFQTQGLTGLDADYVPYHDVPTLLN